MIDPPDWTFMTHSSQRPCLLSARSACRLAVVLSLLAVSPLRAQSRSTGGTYALTTTTDSGGGKPAVVTSMRLRGADGIVRLETRSRGQSDTSAVAGLYLLHFPNADSTLAVMPSSHMTMINANPTAAARALIPHVKQEIVGEPSYQIDDLGDGPLILGLHTKHYRETLAYTTNVALGEEHCTHRVSTTTESWRSTETTLPDMLEAGFSEGLKGEAALEPGLEKLRAIKARRPPGATLRSVSTTQDGVRTTTEATELNTDPVDAALLRAPTDYKVMDMRPVTAAMMNQPAMRDMMTDKLRKTLCAP